MSGWPNCLGTGLLAGQEYRESALSVVHKVRKAGDVRNNRHVRACVLCGENVRVRRDRSVREVGKSWTIESCGKGRTLGTQSMLALATKWRYSELPLGSMAGSWAGVEWSAQHEKRGA